MRGQRRRQGTQRVAGGAENEAWQEGSVSGARHLGRQQVAACERLSIRTAPEAPGCPGVRATHRRNIWGRPVGPMRLWNIRHGKLRKATAVRGGPQWLIKG